MKIKDKNKEQQILNATAEFITREGAAAVSTTKVAKQVGIGQSSLYTYFPTKQALLKAVFDREQQNFAATILATGIADDKLTTKEKLTRYVTALVDFAIASPASLTIIEQIKFLPDFDGIGLNDPHNPVIQLFNSAMAKGVLPKIDASLYVTAIFAVARRNGENIRQQKYTKNAISKAQILRLVLGEDFGAS